MTNINYTIAIMDEEVKERDHFSNFFENEFKVIEIPFVSSVDELIDKIKSLHIDAIAIDYKLKEHKSKFTENGDYFFKQLISRLRDFPSFVLTQDAEKAKKESRLIKPRFIIDKKILHSQNKSEIKEFKDEVKHEIKTYKSLFAAKLKRLKDLQKIKKSGPLSETLENEFLNLNNEISQSLTGYSTLPLKYFSQDTNKKLDEIILKTDELIKKISKKK
jgi:DNA-binding NarL/FixJ family response regulator